MKPIVGDLVKVVRMPLNLVRLHRDHVGGIALIEELTADGDRALVQMIKPPGERDGAMFLPIICLESVNDAASQSLVAAYRRFLKNESSKLAEWRRMRREHIKAVAGKHDMSFEKLVMILDDVLGYDAQYYY